MKRSIYLGAITVLITGVLPTLAVAGDCNASTYSVFKEATTASAVYARQTRCMGDGTPNNGTFPGSTTVQIIEEDGHGWHHVQLGDLRGWVWQDFLRDIHDATPPEPFADAKAHRYSTAILSLRDAGVVEGYSDGSFRPDDKINRAEFTKIITGALYGDISGSHCFSDVKNEWFATYVCYAKTQNIVAGNPDGSFRPSSYINYAEAAKIIANAYNIPLSEPTSVWYAHFIAGLTSKNIVAPTLTDPVQLITRGEMAEMMYRAQSSAK